MFVFAAKHFVAFIACVQSDFCIAHDVIKKINQVVATHKSRYGPNLDGCSDPPSCHPHPPAIGHASGNENISFYPLFMIHNDVIGHLIRHSSMDNHYKLS